MRKIRLWRWSFYFLGMTVMSLGISMTIKGQKLGISPWDVLHIGLYQNIGLTIGSWSIIMGFLIITSTSIVLKQWPKIGTWINMFFIGTFIDLFNWLLPEITSLVGQVIIFVMGVVVITYGVGIYISSNIGAGPRDSLMLVFVEKFGITINKARTIIEVTVAALGWMLGGPIGFGTVLIALVSGRLIQFTLPQSRIVLLKLIGTKDEKVLF